MFSGIIEATSPSLQFESLDRSYRLVLRRPSFFEDLRTGDSIAVDGVCLTVESFDAGTMSFVVGFESLRILGWDPEFVKSHEFNLERSLRMGDRIHGHWVTGHVDSRATVIDRRPEGESLVLSFRIPASVLPLVWHKGSVALNGVSLTVNSVENDVISVCLIPETLKRTNLGALKVGDLVNVEPDMLARAIARTLEVRSQSASQGGTP